MIFCFMSLKMKIVQKFNYYLKPKELYKGLKDGDIYPKKALANQNRFKSDPNEVNRGKWKEKSTKQGRVTNNARIFYET